MNPSDLLRRARDPRFIPGIYNYCDRWCERCAFTSRCLNYDQQDDRNIHPGKKDDGEFLESLSRVFKETEDLVQYVAGQEGVDLDEADEEEVTAAMHAMASANDLAMAHPLSQKANRYFSRVCDFLKDANPWIEELTGRLQNQLGLGIVTEQEAVRKTAKLTDAMEVISWYRMQIYTKIIRALSGQIEGEDFADDNGFPRDSDGSAKVALIGIDRSLQAWAALAELDPGHADQCLDFLAALEQLRKDAETAFPFARAFKRPGFDEMPDRA